MSGWEQAISAWRARWHVPSDVVLCEGDLRLPLDLDDRLHRALLRARLNRASRVELREAGRCDELAWAGRACELLVPLILARSQPTEDRPHTALSTAVARADALVPGYSALLHAQLFGHPLRFDEILTDHVPRLLDNVEDYVVLWWFRRHHDTTRPDTDHHLELCLRLAEPGEYGAAAARLAHWAAELSVQGLLAHVNLGVYQPQHGRYGHGTVMAAAEAVFAADSTAAAAQITMATRAGIPSQAVAAASMANLAACFAPTPVEGCRWLINLLPQEEGKLDRALRDAALPLATPSDDRAALRTYPGGAIVAAAWDRRRVALATYRDRLAEDRDPATVLRSLLHDHHVRAVAADPGGERVTNRLARIAAQRQISLISRESQ